MAKTILLTGGAGFIGSHLNQYLKDLGYITVVLDNLSCGNKQAVKGTPLIEGDIADEPLVQQILEEHKVDGIVHLAAWTAVGESVLDPAKYYENNVVKTLRFLRSVCVVAPLPVVFSSSAAVYGTPDHPTVTETTPLDPINPYGRTKLFCEEILQDFTHAYKLPHVSMRYFNAAGGDPNQKLKNSKKRECNLIPVALKAAKSHTLLPLFGTDYDTPDGSCVRDFIHVMDLASAHEKALQYLFEGGKSECFNLGTGAGYSVKEVLHQIEKTTGISLQVEEKPRRAGDPPILIASADKANQTLEWKPTFSNLEQIVDDAWNALQ